MTQRDIEELNRLNEQREKNFKIFSFISKYLNSCPTLISKETVDEITRGDRDFEQKAFSLFLSILYNENEEQSKRAQREYFDIGIKKLSPAEYLENPYLKNIKIPKAKEGSWSFGYQSYKPYEGFIYKDIEVNCDYKEVPCVGFFDSEFTYPTVFENGVEWMAIKPNEIETMKKPIENARGRVLVYGLGIGYFAYMISLKDSVTSIDVVERDENAIELFQKYILPQLEGAKKIKIIKADALEYAKECAKKGKYDYCFTDLWHDVSDGVELYIKMKRFESYCPDTVYDYWIEKSILSAIRWRIFDGLYAQAISGKFDGTVDEIKKYISDEYLKEFVKHL